MAQWDPSTRQGPMPEPQPATMATPVCYGDHSGYIAVRTDLVETILSEGYKASKRKHVPFSQEPRSGVEAMRSHHGEVEDTTVLEIHGVEESMLDRDKGIVLTKHLGPQHIRRGGFWICEESHYEDEPCPLCGELIPDMASERGEVGEWRYRRNSFMASPCSKDACKQELDRRQARLEEGETVVCYHQLTRELADKVKAAGGKMIRGQQGVAGAGIYFAHTPQETEWKARKRGVVLRCEVKVGAVKELPRHGDRKATFASLVREGKDSVLIKRGICQRPGQGLGKPSGNEIVVYSWDQVRVIGEAPRDPVPPC